MQILGAYFGTLDFVVLIVYFVSMVGIGVGLTRRNRSVEAFTVAARSLPGWAVGISLLGTYVSSISFLALPGKAYSGNWNAFVMGLSLPIAALAAVHWFLPLYRRAGLISAYQYLEERFGPWARVYSGGSFVLLQLGRVGAILYLVALVLAPLTGLSIVSIILIVGVVTIVYTTLGGIEAVIWTDVVQVVILLGGAITAAAVLAFQVPGGPGHLFQTAWANGKFSLGSWGPSVTESTVWVVLVYGIVENLKNFGIDQNYIQRYNSSRTDRDAKWSVWIGAISYIPLSALFFFIGTALYVYYHAIPDRLPATINGDKVFPHFIVDGLPVGITGLILAALLAAAMSTVSSALNSAATVCLTDVYKRYIRPDADERRSLWWLRGLTVWWGIVGTGAGVAFLELVKLHENALDLWWTIAGIFGAGMVGPFLLGAFLRRVGSKSAVVGVIASVAYIIWATLARNLPKDWQWLECHLHTFMIGVAGAVVLMVVGLAASLIWPVDRSRPSPVTVWNVRRRAGL
jgi:SSS family solute:Na+ symporter